MKGVATNAPQATSRAEAELVILMEAAEALRAHDALQQAMRDSEARLRALCHRYDEAGSTWGIQPHHLRHACEARGLMRAHNMGDKTCNS
jgi:hypothetical protein